MINLSVLDTFANLFSNFGNIVWQQVVMIAIGGLLVFLAIKKEMEPTLLLPMGFGTILVNLPLSGAITQAGSTEAGLSRSCLMRVSQMSCFRFCCLSASAP